MNELLSEIMPLIGILSGGGVAAMFKGEINTCLNSVTTIMGRQFNKGDILHIQAPGGRWEKIEILDYRFKIPYGNKPGGVLVYHMNHGYKEYIPFSMWKTFRKAKS